MISYIGAAFLVLGFIVLIQLLGLVDKSIQVWVLARQALADFSNPRLDDDAKEAAMQAYAKKIGWYFILLTGGTAMALLAPAAVIWLLDALDLVSLNAVFTVVLSWEFILGGTVLMIVVFWFGSRRQHGV